MPAKRKPAYTLHKPAGQARVRIDGKDHYLGASGSPESRERYDDLIAEWFILQDVSGYTHVPLGYIRTPLGEVAKDPDSQVQDPFGLAVFWAVPGKYGLTASKTWGGAIGRTYRNYASVSVTTRRWLGMC